MRWRIAGSVRGRCWQLAGRWQPTRIPRGRAKYGAEPKMRWRCRADGMKTTTNDTIHGHGRSHQEAIIPATDPPPRPPTTTCNHSRCLLPTQYPNTLFTLAIDSRNSFSSKESIQQHRVDRESERERGHLFVVSPPTILFAHNPQHFYSIIHHEQRGHTNKTSL